MRQASKAAPATTMPVAIAPSRGERPTFEGDSDAATTTVEGGVVGGTVRVGGTDVEDASIIVDVVGVDVVVVNGVVVVVDVVVLEVEVDVVEDDVVGVIVVDVELGGFPFLAASTSAVKSPVT